MRAITGIAFGPKLLGNRRSRKLFSILQFYIFAVAKQFCDLTENSLQELEKCSLVPVPFYVSALVNSRAYSFLMKNLSFIRYVEDPLPSKSFLSLCVI